MTSPAGPPHPGTTNAKGTCSGGYVGGWYPRLSGKISAGRLSLRTSSHLYNDGSVYTSC
ncbi:hypothetical protein AB0B45_50550 [Nonomuraea sp. NPDC049152]|uniref:hypothetical protein n=1 Tax=Nonomuraea sp. NPDC049152 TaxID=3154350 RepID=UPI00340677DD